VKAELIDCLLQRFGRLVVISRADNNRRGSEMVVPVRL
jgi:hypothetical protein